MNIQLGKILFSLKTNIQVTRIPSQAREASGYRIKYSYRICKNLVLMSLEVLHCTESITNNVQYSVNKNKKKDAEKGQKRTETDKSHVGYVWF